MKDKLNPNSRNQRNVINMGTALMVVILMGLSFSVIAALSISSAKNNLDLSRNMSIHTKEYYEACNKAYDIIDKKGWRNQSFEVPITDKQVLNVEIQDSEIVTWQVSNVSNWESENSLPVHIAD